MKITILTDNKKSWVIPYVNILAKKLSKNHSVYHTYSMNKVEKSDVLFILSCENIITKDQLKVCKNNIVIHPSRLPNGRGWSPVAWQVLEGIDRLPISLFEAEPTVDSGPIYLTDYIELNGTELNDDIKHLQGLKTIDMAIKYINNWPMVGIPQDESKSTYYKKRTLNSSELDMNKTLSESFNLLRVVDNERYPAFFYKNSKKYIIKIYKAND